MTPVNFIIMSSGDGLSPVRHQSNGALSSFWLLWTNCSQGFIKLYKSDKNQIKLVNFCRFYFKGSLPNQTSVMLWRLSVFHYPQNGHFMHANPVTERLIYNIEYFVILYQNIKHEYDVAVLFFFFSFFFFLGGGAWGWEVGWYNISFGSHTNDLPLFIGIISLALEHCASTSKVTLTEKYSMVRKIVCSCDTWASRRL